MVVSFFRIPLFDFSGRKVIVAPEIAGNPTCIRVNGVACSFGAVVGSGMAAAGRTLLGQCHCHTSIAVSR